MISDQEQTEIEKIISELKAVFDSAVDGKYGAPEVDWQVLGERLYLRGIRRADG